MGVFTSEFVEPTAKALLALGSEAAIVVHGAGGLDEFSLIEGKNVLASVSRGDREIESVPFDTASWSQAPRIKLSDIAGGVASENAKALTDLLSDADALPAYRDMVLINASFALGLARGDGILMNNWRIAEQSLRSGAAKRALTKLVALTKDAP